MEGCVCSAILRFKNSKWSKNRKFVTTNCRLFAQQNLAIFCFQKVSIAATPFNIIKEISAYFQTNSSTDHQLLKQEAEATKLTSDTSVEDYIHAHRSIRTKMRNAKYPNIGDEQITVDFMINGLDGHPSFRHIPDTWVENDTLPTTIKATEDRLRCSAIASSQYD